MNCRSDSIAPIQLPGADSAIPTMAYFMPVNPGCSNKLPAAWSMEDRKK
jgi:hypothetical protein